MFFTQTISTLQAALLSVTVTGYDNSVVSGPYVETYNLDLESDNIALYVTLSSGDCDGRFSDNGLIVTRNVTKLKFFSKDYLSVEELQNCVSVRSYQKIS